MANSIASGTRVVVAYQEETTAGVQPVAVDLTEMVLTTRNINAKKATLESDRIRADRQKTDVRHGFNSVEGSLGFELSLEDQDDMLEAALSGTWAGIAAATPGVVTIDAGAKTITRTVGSYITDGFRPGDIIVGTGWTQTANNTRMLVTAVTALMLTVEDADAVLVNDSGNGDTTVFFDMDGERLDIGQELRTFTIERGFVDVSRFQVFHGVAVGQMTLNIQPDAIIGGELTMIGMNFDPVANTSIDGDGYTALPANPPFAAFDGSLHEGGQKVAVVTGVDITLTNGRTLTPVVGSKFSPCVFEGQALVSLSLAAFFTDGTFLNKFINEEESTMFIKLDDPLGVGFMNIVFPRIKYTGGDMDPPQEGAVSIDMPARALLDVAQGTTMSIQRSA